MRFILGYLVFVFLRITLTVTVGWIALECARSEFEVVSTALALAAEQLRY